jgi:GTP pyrophosphokinase
MILGKKIWQRELRNLKISSDNLPNESDICQAFKVSSIGSFYENLGKSDISSKQVYDFLKQFSEKASAWQKLKIFNVFSSSEDTPIIIGYNERFLLNYASCCNPLPGDAVKGIFKNGKGIEIHKVSCKNLNRFPQEQQLSLQWEQPNIARRKFKCILKIEAKENVAIEKIFYAVANHNAVVKKAIFESKEGQLAGRLDLLGFNSAQVKTIEQSLQLIAGVKKVTVL